MDKKLICLVSVTEYDLVAQSFKCKMYVPVPEFHQNSPYECFIVNRFNNHYAIHCKNEEVLLSLAMIAPSFKLFDQSR